MAKSFNIESINRLPPGPHGLGAKVVEGYMTLGPCKEAVHHSDLGLNTIKALFVENNDINSHTIVNVSAPGTYDNYASLTVYNLMGTGGYPAVRTAGTLGARFLAIGE
jgi:hypothetical protein